MNPCMNARGLLLASASTRYPRGGYRFGFNDRNIILGANSQDRGHHDKVPVLAQHGFEATSEQERSISTTSVLPRHGVLVWNPGHSVGKVPVSELSLSSEEECLSLQAEYSTKVQNMQDDIPLRRWAIPPRHECAGLPSAISVICIGATLR